MGDRGKPRAAAALAALALLLTAGGCGGERANTMTPQQAAAHARLMRLGARVFAAHCRTCHPLLGRANSDFHSDAPALDLDEVQGTRAYVVERVEDGGVAMGGFASALSPARKRAIVAYILAVGGRDVSVPKQLSPAERALGAAVYAARCQRCHQLGGRRPTRPNPIWVGTNFDLVRPSVGYVERLLRSGQREAMPAFRRVLTPQQLRAVARYLAASARAGAGAG